MQLQESFGVAIVNSGYFKVARIDSGTHRTSESNRTMAEQDVTQGTEAKSNLLFNEAGKRGQKLPARLIFADQKSSAS
jgi:hypothetical protein